MSEQQNEYFSDQLVRFPYYGPQGKTVTSNGMTITIDSHDLTACTLCGGVMVTHDDLDVCQACGSRRVRSQAKQAAAAAPLASCPFCRASNVAAQYDECGGWAVWCRNCEASGPRYVNDPDAARQGWNRRAASRDTSLIAYVDDLLDVLQEVGGMSAAWCETKMQEYETLLKGA